MKNNFIETQSHKWPQKTARPLSWAVYALMLSTFAFGMAEFIIIGLLPNVAHDLNVSISSAGFLVTGYALGIVIGAPLLTVVTGKLSPKSVLLLLLALFTLGNVLAAIAPNYLTLLLARIIAAFANGAFFGIGTVVATEMVAPDKRASAFATMFTGLTLANIIGVPLGTFLGQQVGWHSPFWVIVALSLLAFMSITFLIPRTQHTSTSGLGQEFRILGRKQVLLALLMTTFGFGGVFTIFTYITPFLERITGFSPTAVSLILVLFGVASTLGTIIGGKAADWKLMCSLLVSLVLLALIEALFTITGHNMITAVVTIFLFGIAAFAIIPMLQVRIVDRAKGATALAAAFNAAAFNLGNAGGAFLGGIIAASPQLGLNAITWVGAIVTVVGILITLWSMLLDRH
ncbi:MFS transporter [Dictyobacter sp. S3.2.2.5]|uniref:MFS transporter n=1 Tax=Dictyobacter halimunensis TaxID=3026934 RepID=A0ABQ6FGW2_9CHLR|nr:MFS transporter [Dictyobacter sp. S3.2.2.5]